MPTVDGQARGGRALRTEGDTDVIIGGSTTFDIGAVTPAFGASAVTAPAIQSAYPGSVMGGGLSVANPLAFDPLVGASPFASSVTTYQTPFSAPAPFVYPTTGQPGSVLYAHYAPATTAAATTTPATTTPSVATAPVATPVATTPATTTGGGAQTRKKKQAQERNADATKADETKKAADKPVARKTVTVKAGDTLSKLAAAHGVSWQKLYELNKGVIGGNPNVIRPGQTLKLP